MSRNKWDKIAWCSQPSNVKWAKTSSWGTSSNQTAMAIGTRRELTRSTSCHPWTPKLRISYKTSSTRPDRKQQTPLSRNSSRKRRAKTMSHLMKILLNPVHAWMFRSYKALLLKNRSRSLSPDPTFGTSLLNSRLSHYPRLRTNTQRSNRPTNTSWCKKNQSMPTRQVMQISNLNRTYTKWCSPWWIKN